MDANYLKKCYDQVNTIGQHITEPESISEVTEHPNKY